MGGSPKLLVPDNAKVAVIKACLYDPQVNRTYAEMAAHYDMAVLPARPRKPKDKAKVEAGVLIVERWLLGRLRNHKFHSLAELNQAIRDLLRHLNEVRPFRRLGVTRRQLAPSGRPDDPAPQYPHPNHGDIGAINVSNELADVIDAFLHAHCSPDSYYGDSGITSRGAPRAAAAMNPALLSSLFLPVLSV